MYNNIHIKFKNPNEIAVPAVGFGIISSTGIANGRNIPIIIVESDEQKIIDDIIITHETTRYGHCNSQWGSSFDKETIILMLDFEDPIKKTIYIYFDFMQFGMAIDQILYSQCLYIMTGEKGTKVSENIEKDKILIEVPNDWFSKDWEGILKKNYVRHLQKEKNITKKAANEIFHQIRSSWKKIESLRM